MILAALDIGSNSIHLVVVETDAEKPFRVLANGKEMVRLGRSVARDGSISPDAMSRALAAIELFALRARSYGASEILAAATSATREAANREEFLARVLDQTGIHIDLLSGIEEARLIALAVAARERPRARAKTLAIDIGGGSTELALLRGPHPEDLISLKLGAVRLTERFVSSDPISDKQLKRLRAELRGVIAPRAAEVKRTGFDACYGTSGTINTLAATLAHKRSGTVQSSGEPQSSGLPIRISELRALNAELCTMDLEARAKLPGVSRARAEILVAGGQLLEALMESLSIEVLRTSEWALREGMVIAYLARRTSSQSAAPAKIERDKSLRGAFALLEHYRADRKHALRTAYFAGQLFDALRALHLLGSEHRRLLLAAALLHDIGYLVSHTNHHKHSAYLIQNSELTGFMESEVALIANIARYHRSSLPKLKHPFYAALDEADRETVRRLAALLRLADAFDRDHQGRVRKLDCRCDGARLRITALGARAAESALWRVEERADLLKDVFGLAVEVAVEGGRENAEFAE